MGRNVIQADCNDTSSVSPPPVGRTMNAVMEDPPSSPMIQEMAIAVRNFPDTVGGGQGPGGTAGVRVE